MKIVLLCGSGESGQILANSVHGLRPDDQLRIIVQRPSSPKKHVKFRIKRLGYFKVFGQILFILSVPKILKRISSARINQIYADYSLNDADDLTKDALRVDTINDPRVVAELTSFEPDVILVNGTGIIRSKVLSCVDAPFINTHVGITPMYRGVHGGYWSLWRNDAANFGVTVHLVDTGVDTGKPLYFGRVKPTKLDNFSTYPLLQQAVALEGIQTILETLADGKELIPLSVQTDFSRQWFHPTIFEYLWGLFKGVK